MKWRQKTLIFLVTLTLAISLFIKFYDFFTFYFSDPYLNAGKEQQERILYGNDYPLIVKGLSLPTDARILVLNKPWISNYYFYPRELYFFKTAGASPEQLERFIIEHRIEWVATVKDEASGGTQLLRVPGFSGTPEKSGDMEKYGDMYLLRVPGFFRTVTGLLATLPAIILAGAGILWIVRRIMRRYSHETEHFNLTEAMPLSFGLGAGFVPLLLFYLNLSGIKVNIISLLIIIIPLSVSGVFYFGILSASDNGVYRKREMVMIVLLFVIVLFTAAKAVSTPMRCFDDRAKWSYKAKVIFHEGSALTDSFSNPARLHIDRRYPLSLPYLEAAFHLAMGGFDDKAVKIIFPLFFAAILMMLFNSQRWFSSRSHALLFTLVFAALPFLSISPPEEGGSADTGYADLPLSFFYATSVLYLYRWMKKGDGLLISTMCMAAALFVKQEGMILYAAWAAAVIVIAIRRGNPAKAGLPRNGRPRGAAPTLISLAALLFPIALNLPFFIFSLTLPADGIDYAGSLSLKAIIANIERAPLIVGYMAGAFLSFQWGFIGALIVVTALLYAKSSIRPANIFLLWTILFPLFCYIILLIVTPIDAFWQMRVAFDRLILHVAPIAIFFISRVCVSPDFPQNQ